MTSIQCEACGKPSSVIIRCHRCNRGYCQVCSHSPLHGCSSEAIEKKKSLVEQGYEPLGSDTLVPVTARCICGESIAGQFATVAEAKETLDAWKELHSGKGHSLAEAP